MRLILLITIGMLFTQTSLATSCYDLRKEVRKVDRAQSLLKGSGPTQLYLLKKEDYALSHKLEAKLKISLQQNDLKDNLIDNFCKMNDDTPKEFISALKKATIVANTLATMEKIISAIADPNAKITINNGDPKKLLAILKKKGILKKGVGNKRVITRFIKSFLIGYTAPMKLKSQRPADADFLRKIRDYLKNSQAIASISHKALERTKNAIFDEADVPPDFEKITQKQILAKLKKGQLKTITKEVGCPFSKFNKQQNKLSDEVSTRSKRHRNVNSQIEKIKQSKKYKQLDYFKHALAGEMAKYCKTKDCPSGTCYNADSFFVGSKADKLTSFSKKIVAKIRKVSKGKLLKLCKNPELRKLAKESCKEKASFRKREVRAKAIDRMREKYSFRICRNGKPCDKVRRKPFGKLLLPSIIPLAGMGIQSYFQYQQITATTEYNTDLGKWQKYRQYEWNKALWYNKWQTYGQYQRNNYWQTNGFATSYNPNSTQWASYNLINI